MKFKLLVVFINITLIIFLVIMVLLPFFMPGFSPVFWQVYWPLALTWLLLFSLLNGFYFYNRELYSLLERENWPALVRYLEDRIIQKGKYSPRLVRLLANCYLLLSDSAAVMSLENKTAIVKPALVDENVLIFGCARILGKDISGAARFFGTRRETAKSGIRDWVRWYYGFALLLGRQYENAGEEFTLLARLSKDLVVAALSSYFLSEHLAPGLIEKRLEYRETAFSCRERVKKALPQIKNWNREAERLTNEIHAAAIFKHMEETKRWLYN